MGVTIGQKVENFLITLLASSSQKTLHSLNKLSR